MTGGEPLMRARRLNAVLVGAGAPKKGINADDLPVLTSSLANQTTPLLRRLRSSERTLCLVNTSSPSRSRLRR